MIAFDEDHIGKILKSWIAHCNKSPLYRASDRAFQYPGFPKAKFKSNDTFRRIIGLRSDRYSEALITSTDLKKLAA
jgi:hypothetical protein